MKFSILIANYNNGNYFEDCYNSIIQQSYNNWEVIIVDDCSTDDSVQTIKDIIGEDERFKIFTQTENHGCGMTKNLCASYATGDIFGYLDPDDALTQDAIKLSLQAYAKFPEIVATYSRITFCDGHLNPVHDFKPIQKVWNNKYFFNAPIQIHHFFTFKKEIYNKTIGIDTTLESAVDQDLYLKILEHGNPFYIPKNLYLYRRHSTGISQASLKNKAKENFAKVIWFTMQRRGLNSINGKKVPEQYTTQEEIFELLEYQNKIPFRVRKKIKLYLQNILERIS